MDSRVLKNCRVASKCVTNLESCEPCSMQWVAGILWSGSWDRRTETLNARRPSYRALSCALDCDNPMALGRKCSGRYARSRVRAKRTASTAAVCCSVSQLPSYGSTSFGTCAGGVDCRNWHSCSRKLPHMCVGRCCSCCNELYHPSRHSDNYAKVSYYYWRVSVCISVIACTCAPTCTAYIVVCQLCHSMLCTVSFDVVRIVSLVRCLLVLCAV
uniref:Uncharacterized protein n=1 Tax=Lygus hesperus TaxID=30085 RepID=A0A146LK33_LYGHE